MSESQESPIIAHDDDEHAQARAEAAARDLVGQWDRLLRVYSAALPELAADPTLSGTREQLMQFGRSVREQPWAVTVQDDAARGDKLPAISLPQTRI